VISKQAVAQQPDRPRMKICLLAYKFYESSPAMMQFASSFAEQGDDIDVICLGRENQPEFARSKGVNIYRLQPRVTNEKDRLSYLWRTVKFFFLATIFISRKHWERQYDLIHVQNVPDFLVFAAFVPRVLGVPVILDVHDIVPEFYASKFTSNRSSVAFRLLVGVERLSAAFASHVIAPTHLWQERLVSRSVKSEKCTTIRYLPDPRMFYPRPKEQSSERFLIVYPGTLNRHQGVDVAIKALAKILPAIPQAEFHVYGEGPAKPYLAELARSLGVAHKVKLAEMLPKEQVIDLMAQADVAVEPKLVESRFANETCSVKMLEFMALGIPIVASRTRVHAFYYDDRMIKFYEADREEDVASAILLLAGDEVLRRSLVANALKYIEANNWLKERERYRELVKRLQATRKRPRNLQPRRSGEETQITGEVRTT
jgi:glycosyltransferase involved in cell wall biosynthesis